VTLSQFKSLPQDTQYNTVWERGVLIDARMTNEYTFVLYELDSFYVEIQYDVECNKIIELKSFTSLKPLNDYLNLK